MLPTLSKRFLTLIFSGLALTAVISTAQGYDRVTGELFASRSEVMAQNGMAATSHPLATQIALDILKSGGHAVDAAIAANAALGLMEPTGNGIGGDLFAIVWDAKTQTLQGYNGSGRSPQSLTLEWFIENGYEDIPPRGPLPVSVPGVIDGWFALHERYGALEMADVLAPAIEYARKGHPVHELIAWYWDRSVPVLAEFPGFLEQFTIDGRAPRAGELWKNPNYADTLDMLIQEGRDGFYKGEMARRIGEYMASHGGFLSYEDLASHQGNWVDPVSTNYRGYDVWQIPPNGQGIAGLQILNILEAFDLSSYGFGSPEHIHLFVEAKKLAFEDRARHYADPEFMEVDVEWLISKHYADERRSLIDMDEAAETVEAGRPQLNEGDTIYLTTADKDGNMVSLIQSNYRGMGSGMTPPDAGFILQNRGEMFVLKDGHPNSFAPSKRPFHTIIPAFITKDGSPWVSFGLMGGGMQPQGHAQIVINLIDFGMGLQEAGDAPRIHHTGSTEPTGQALQMTDGGTINLESGFSYQTIRALLGKGHDIAWARGPFGGYQAIMVEHDMTTTPPIRIYRGASESRKDGQAAGF